VVNSVRESLEAARRIFALHINGFAVEHVLVVEALAIAAEYYAAIAVDRSAKSIVCIVCAAGGVDIEETARRSPEEIITLPFPEHATGEIPAEALALVFGDHAAAASHIIAKLYRLLCENDCSLVEVNPLVLTKDGKLVAADAKIVIDDSALYRHSDLEALRNREEYTADELDARSANLSFVGLDGSVGCMVNGAGLAMATMDLIQLAGGRPANFLDVGGSSNPEKVISAFKILLANPSVRAILVNIFGGITRCDDIARGIIAAKEQLHPAVPLVIRLTGTNEEEGRQLLGNAGITALTDMTEAVRQAVASAGAIP
jgi:succinyl-CoA synthetase beta subunit